MNPKRLILKSALFMLCILSIMLVLKYLPRILELTVSLTEFRAYIVSLESFGSIVFIFFQMLQTVVAPIPGEVVQVAGGYIYGVTLGMFYSILGLLLGAIVAFYFTRFLGATLIGKIITKKNSQWMIDVMNNKRFSIVLFIIFLIPGLPKDFLIYVAGLTPINPFKFFGILIVSRFPSLLASVSIGSNLHYGNYISTIIIVVLALVSFILGLLYKDKLISKFSENKNTW